ncbi:hypothetical protein [Enterococcus faecalis]|uniref:hypothetical protein n=1 Tax=Enterococcus faecalis TaxID=1351 RepID=UPI0025B1E425|nr:hypothetical protein [Enterococcus faecalis]MDN3168363.1 hypothetical protein [Enterococcus faecalis]
MFLFLILLIWLLGFIAKVFFIQSLFTNYWLIIIAGVGILVWILFSLKWDNKNFIDYILGRGATFYRKRNGTSMNCSYHFFMKKSSIKSKENKGSEKMFYMKKVSKKAKLKFLKTCTSQSIPPKFILNVLMYEYSSSSSSDKE